MPAYRSRYGRFVNRYSPYIRAAARLGHVGRSRALYGAAAIGAGHAYHRGRKRKVTSGRGVTTQYDKARIYKKKRMPRKKRAAWKKFSKKVGHVIDKNLGTRTVVFNEIVTYTTTAGSSEQLNGQVALYPVRNDTYTHLNDLKALYDNYSGNADFDETNKLIFQSGVLDMTIQNASVDTNGDQCQVEMDIYEITSKSTWQEEGTTNVGLTKVISDGFNTTGNEGTAASGGLVLTQRGVTPFDAAQALSQFKLKIWKKTKYFLGANQTMTYQMRDPKRRVVDVLKIGDWDSSNMPGWTKWLLIIAKATPAVDLTTTGQVDLRVGVTRKYMYKQLDSTHDADASLQQAEGRDLGL